MLSAGATVVHHRYRIHSTGDEPVRRGGRGHRDRAVRAARRRRRSAVADPRLSRPGVADRLLGERPARPPAAGPDPGDEVRHPPAQEVEPAAQAVAGHREQRLEARPRRARAPSRRSLAPSRTRRARRSGPRCRAVWAKRGGYSCSGVAGGSARRRDDPAPDRAVDRPAEAERRAGPDRERGHDRARTVASARTPPAGIACADTPAPNRWPRGRSCRALREAGLGISGDGTGHRGSPGRVARTTEAER